MDEYTPTEVQMRARYARNRSISSFGISYEKAEAAFDRGLAAIVREAEERGGRMARIDTRRAITLTELEQIRESRAPGMSKATLLFILDALGVEVLEDLPESGAFWCDYTDTAGNTDKDALGRVLPHPDGNTYQLVLASGSPRAVSSQRARTALSNIRPLGDSDQVS